MKKKLVKEDSISANQRKVSLSTEGLPKGVYTLKVVTASNVITKKVNKAK